jgi:hypothetical protein
MAMQSLESATSLAESALHAVLAPYGDNGIELNDRPSDMYSVMGEVSYNTFKKVVKVRSHPHEGLCMIVEGETEWRPLDTSDYQLLINEVWDVVKGDE